MTTGDARERQEFSGVVHGKPGTRRGRETYGEQREILYVSRYVTHKAFSSFLFESDQCNPGTGVWDCEKMRGIVIKVRCESIMTGIGDTGKGREVRNITVYLTN